MQTIKTIEVVIFKLKPDVSEKQAIDLLSSLNPLIEKYPGFISRKLSKNEEGLWLDTVNWESLAQAKSASDDIMNHEGANKVFDIIDTSSMQFYHFTPIEF